MDGLVEREGHQVLANSRGLGTGALIAALYLCGYLCARLRERLEDGEH